MGDIAGMNRYLLIISCSQRKRTDPEPMPAIERYDGVNFRMLRRLRRQGELPANLDILIVSAKYGLLRGDDAITWYDQRMTRQRALELQASTSNNLDGILRTATYQEIFVNLGKDYMPTLRNSKAILGTKTIYAAGGIGRKMAQMKEWIVTRRYSS